VAGDAVRAEYPFSLVSNGSSNKKVAKAASAGGSNLSRRARSTSSSFNATIIGVCIAGIALIIGSVIGRTILESPPYAANSKKVKSALADLKKIQKASKPDAKKLEAATKKYNDLQSDTHVHSAYGIWNCDKYISPFDASQLPDTLGIHAHEDGLLHIHPFVSRAAGKKARLKLFFEATHMTMTDKKLSWIADTLGTKLNTLSVDKDKCGGKKAEIWLLYWENAIGKNVTKTPVKYLGDFGNLRLTGDSAYAFVFAPKGTKIPSMPPSVASLPAPADLNAGAAASTATDSTTATTVVSPATTIAGSATTKAGSATTIAGSATTAAPSPTTAAAPATTAAAPATTAAAPATTAAGSATTVKK
jgi:hypothetical protein